MSDIIRYILIASLVVFLGYAAFFAWHDIATTPSSENCSTLDGTC